MATIMDPNGTNFIVNNTLYFIYGSLKFDTEANVTRKCESFYAIEDIVKAKKDLFDAVQSFKCMSGVKNINRQTRNDTGARKVVEDIIFVLKKCDNEGEQLPLFYSSDFCDIPRLDAPDGLVSKIDAVMSTILWMQKNFVTQETLEKTIVKLSTFAAAASTSSTTKETTLAPFSQPSVAEQPESCVSLAGMAPLAASAPPAPLSPSAPPEVTSLISAPTSFAHAVGDPSLAASLLSSQKSTPEVSPPAAAQHHPRSKAHIRQDDQRRRGNSKSRTIIGQKVSAGLLSFKGVDQTVTKYVGHVANSASIEDVRKWLESENEIGSVSVVNLEELVRRHTLWKSFKVTIKREDKKTVENPMFWPKGVVARPFFHPKAAGEAQSWEKRNNSGGEASTAASNGAVDNETR